MGTHNITGVGTFTGTGVVSGSRFSAATPSCMSAFSNGGSLSFTGGTARLIPFVYNATLNPASDLTVTTSSGLVTYSGTATRYFRVCVEFAMQPLNVSGQGIQFFISLNSSLTVTEAQTWNFYAISGATLDYLPNSIERILQLSTGNTVQFAGILNGTTSSLLRTAESVL